MCQTLSFIFILVMDKMKLKKTELISNIFLESNVTKVAINYKQNKTNKKTRKFTNIFLTKKQVEEEIKILRQMKMEAQHTKTYGTQKKQF